MKHRIIIFLLLCSSVVWSQKDYKGATVILAKESVANMNYYEYDQAYKADPSVLSFEDVELEFPEQFFHALISARTQSWIDSLSFEKKSYTDTHANTQKINDSFVEVRSIAGLVGSIL